MSHFKVAVITDGTKSVGELLAPYQEGGIEDVPREFLEFVDCTEEVTSEYEEEYHDFYFDPDASTYTLHSKYDPIFDKGDGNFEYPKEWHKVRVPMKLMYPDISEYASVYHGYDSESGHYGYWENPNAKWDWFTPLPEHGTWCDDYMGGAVVRLSDISFDPEKQFREEAKWWDEHHDEDSLLTYFHIHDMDREHFLETAKHLWFRAVITPDGEWHEVGRMGWWGMSSEKSDETYEWAIHFEERFIDPLPDTCVLHVVDCHI